MKTSSAKAKGRRASQQLKDLMITLAPYLEPEDIVVTPSGVTGEDLGLSPKARRVYPISIEVKNQEKAKVWEWIEQAAGHNPSFPPVVFFKRNRSDMYAIIEAKQLLKLLTRCAEDNTDPERFRI